MPNTVATPPKTKKFFSAKDLAEAKRKRKKLLDDAAGLAKPPES